MRIQMFRNRLTKSAPLFALLAILLLATGGIVAAQGGVLRGEHASSAVTFPQGKARISVQSFDCGFGCPLNVPGDGTRVNVASTNFTVPSGKVAEITAFVNAEAQWNGSSGGYCYGQLHLDSPTGTLLHPGRLWLVDGNVYNHSSYPTISMNGFSDIAAVGAGTHTVYFVMDGTGDGCTIYSTSLIVIANIHRP